MVSVVAVVSITTIVVIIVLTVVGPRAASNEVWIRSAAAFLVCAAAVVMFMPPTMELALLGPLQLS